MKIKLASLFFISIAISTVSAQEKTAVAEDLKFTPVVEVKATPVKDQSKTGSCWSFATTSLIESELLRLGKGEYDFSEMYIVRYNYIDKLNDNYLRSGKGNTEEGGLAHDWIKVFAQHGIVPDEIYPGLNYGLPKHDHYELNSFLKALAETTVSLKKQSDQYRQIVESTLDIWLGKVPENFTYKGTSYTPASFAKNIEINPDDYIEITSFTHFPFYSKETLDVPDNWRMCQFYNVPIDEFMQIIDNALNNGYTIGWDGDISEEGFSHSKGVAVFPSENVTQEMRQKMFENFSTTDDHMMHVTGISQDQHGGKYYITKNSWGAESNKFGGYMNMSEQYVRAKTVFILVNKNSIPQSIRAKLGV